VSAAVSSTLQAGGNCFSQMGKTFDLNFFTRTFPRWSNLVDKIILTAGQKTFLAWVVCFPITDHVIFSENFVFNPSINYSFVDTELFENLKARILKSTSHGLKWGNKLPMLKGLFAQCLAFNETTDVNDFQAHLTA